MLCLAHAPAAPGLLVGNAVLGGTGARLVYAACTSTTGTWFPERAAARIGFLTGAFAYGSAPLVLALLVAPVDLVALDVFAVVLCAAVLGCGLLLADPPPHWWPTHVAPRRWALTRPDPPAAREFSVLEGAAHAHAGDGHVLVVRRDRVAVRRRVPRAVRGRAGRGGLPRHQRSGPGTLRWVVAVQAVGQVVLLVAVGHGSPALLFLGAAVAGVGGGAFYPLFAALARAYFGEQSVEAHGLVYSAKAVSGVAAVLTTRRGFPVALLAAAALSLFAAAL